MLLIEICQFHANAILSIKEIHLDFEKAALTAVQEIKPGIGKLKVLQR